MVLFPVVRMVMDGGWESSDDLHHLPLILPATPRTDNHRKGDLFVLYRTLEVEGKVLISKTLNQFPSTLDAIQILYKHDAGIYHFSASLINNIQY